MECSCVSVDFDEYSHFYREKLTIAHKPHKCGECGSAIQPGMQYCYSVGKTSCGFWTHKTCLDCLSIRDQFFCDGWYAGMIRELTSDLVRDCLGDISQTKISQLTPRAREWVCGLIEDIWEEYYDEEEE